MQREAIEPDDAGRAHRLVQAGAAKHVPSQGTQAFAANFVAGEAVLLDKMNGYAAARQQKGRHAAGRAGADDRRFVRSGIRQSSRRRAGRSRLARAGPQAVQLFANFLGHARVGEFAHDRLAMADRLAPAMLLHGR